MRPKRHELHDLILEDGCFVRCIEGEQQAVRFKAVEEIGHPIGDIGIGGVPTGQVEKFAGARRQARVPGGFHGDPEQFGMLR